MEKAQMNEEKTGYGPDYGPVVSEYPVGTASGVDKGNKNCKINLGQEMVILCYSHFFIHSNK